VAKKKHIRKMTNDELVEYLFHPKVVEHLRQAVKDTNEKAERKSRKKKPTS
jgi:hypothetical protein